MSTEIGFRRLFTSQKTTGGDCARARAVLIEGPGGTGTPRTGSLGLKRKKAMGKRVT